MARENIKTTKKQIVNYWKTRISEIDIGADWDEAEKRCWRCGRKENIQRCHIIPASLQGEDIESNFVLLCDMCHSEAPNVNDNEIIWDWIKAYSYKYSIFFWEERAVEEYCFIYKHSIYSDVEFLQKNGCESVMDKVLLAVSNCQSDVSFHFGQSHLNLSTMVGNVRMCIKNIVKENGLEDEWKKYQMTDDEKMEAM